MVQPDHDQLGNPIPSHHPDFYLADSEEEDDDDEADALIASDASTIASSLAGDIEAVASHIGIIGKSEEEEEIGSRQQLWGFYTYSFASEVSLEIDICFVDLAVIQFPKRGTLGHCLHC